MKATTLKTILAVAVITLTSITAKADNGKKPFIFSPSIEIKSVEMGKIQITTNFIAAVQSTNFEIQRSYDNKNFQSIAIIMGDAEAESFQPFKINDKIKSSSAKIYYRIVKTVKSKSTIVSKSTIKM